MASLQHERLEQLFSAALKQSTWSARAVFLDHECGDDVDLRSQVTELLKAHDQVGTFLDTPPAELNETRDFCTRDEAAGMRIGRYKIIDKIGEGGFGSVFMAEQEEPVRRRVALKIIKLGMDTKDVIARFEAERQALAMMDHANIARVFDAGATDTGRPYFVMELVKGIAINNYCDDNRLTIHERLELFLPICHAVQHAHQKGIIHRDLKPSNILVTLQEGKRIPKVIDFGIAKATSQRLTEKTLHTAFRQLIGTPEYMSPDQAEIGGANVDTRTDIYSLGVVLYELLTSGRPFDGEMLANADLADVLRIIREVDPPKPSTRWLTPNSAEELTRLARLRRSEPRALSRWVRGDLDWIVMKAMDKDRTRRYATAKDLADDITRHLEHEPVLARGPSLAYRCRKFVRRHRVGVLTGSIVVVALIAGLTLATVGLLKANRAGVALKMESDAARHAHASAAAANEFLQQMLAAVDPDKALGREVTVRYVLDEAAGKIKDGALSGQPEVEAAVRMTLGETYEGLGLYRTAEEHLRAAAAIRERIFGDQDPDTLRAQRALAGVLRIQNDFSAAEKLLRRTAEAQSEVLGDSHPDTLATMTELALALWRPGKYTEAESIHRHTLEIQSQVLGEKHPNTLESLIYLGGVNRVLEDHDEAETHLRKALKLCRDVHGEEHPRTTDAMNSLGLLLEDQHRYDEAEQLFQQTYELDRHLLGPDHPRTLITMNNVLRVLAVQGKVDQRQPLIRDKLTQLHRAAQRPDAGAVDLHAYAWELLNCELAELRDPQAALSVARRAVEMDEGQDAQLLETLARAHHVNGDLDQAIAVQRQAISRARRGESYSRAKLEVQLITYLAENGDLVGAASVSWDKLDLRLGRNLLAAEPPGTSLIIQADELMAEERYAEAAAVLRGCLGIRQKELPEGHLLIADTQSQLGAALAADGKHREAEPILLDVYDQLQANQQVPIQQKRLAIERIIQMYETWNNQEQASLWRDGLMAIGSEEDNQSGANDGQAAARSEFKGADALQALESTSVAD